MKKTLIIIFIVLCCFVNTYADVFESVFCESGGGGGSGDVISVGDCTDGACYDGSSDGGTYVRLYDGDSNYGQFAVPNLAGDRTYTLPAFTTTIIGTLLDELDRPSRTSAPGTPINGALYHCAIASWNPLGRAGSIDYWVVYDSASYVGLWDDAGDFLMSTVQAAGNVITDADGIVLVASQMMSTIVMTGAGDVDIPADQCDTVTGKWLIVKSTAAHLNSLTSNDASDQFVLSDGTALTAGNELDLAGAAGSQVTVQCLQVNKWWVIGEIGTAVDGGGAD
jgi:hypothetical protein